VTTLTRLALALSVGAVPVSGSGGDLSWNMEGATRHGARWGRQIALKAGTREHKRREGQNYLLALRPVPWTLSNYRPNTLVFAPPAAWGASVALASTFLNSQPPQL
jgi:hypothetical protein